MNDLRLWANYYYNMGFNVTHIKAKKNQSAKNPYKSATNDRFAIQNRRQELSELQSFDWENSDGIGVVLGFNNLRAIDFDFFDNKSVILENKNNIKGVFPVYPLQAWQINKSYYKNNETFIAKVLELLRLPTKYEWVVKTPNGFHILFIALAHDFKLKGDRTKAFTPNEITHDRIGLKQIELRWNKHLVLPPSKNKNGNNYNFFLNELPKNLPYEVSLSGIHALLDELSYEEYNSGSPYSDNADFKSGYNLYRSNYYDINDNDSIKHYEEDEYLDFSPVYFKKDNIIPDEWLK